MWRRTSRPFARRSDDVSLLSSAAFKNVNPLPTSRSLSNRTFFNSRRRGEHWLQKETFTVRRIEKGAVTQLAAHLLNAHRNYSTESKEQDNDTKTKIQEDTTNLPASSDPDKIPIPALVLGVTSLIPMFTGALAVGLELVDPILAYNVVFYQMTYAASLLSFTGAVHLGLAMADYQRAPPVMEGDGKGQQQPQQTKPLSKGKRDWLRYSLSIVPCLVSWGALAVPLQFYGMMAIMTGFTGVFIGDAIAHKYGLVPAWYMKLRAPVTIGATIALGISLMVHL